MKMSFIGDIMCELPLQKAIKDEKAFEKLFSGMNAVFASSDYVVGNLETIFAGRDKIYTKDLFSFNTCDAFVRSIKKCGIDMVSTANNHCLDRGIEGLLRTIEILDANEIEHVGTYGDQEDSHYLIKQFGDLKIAFLSYTYGTNIDNNHVELQNNNRFHVDLLEPQKSRVDASGIKARIMRCFTEEKKLQIKKILGRSYVNIVEDRNADQIDTSYFEDIRNNIEEAKKQVDYVVLLLHCGGQFNTDAGSYTKSFMDFFEKSGVDIIIGNHPHIVQQYSEKGDKIRIYSLGNFSISPSSIYVPKDLCAEYSILFNIYFDEKKKIIDRKSFQILKIIEQKDGWIDIFPVYDLYKILKDDMEKAALEKDCRYIARCFLNGKEDCFRLEQEYVI